MTKKKTQNALAGFEFLEHPADKWVHAWGPNLAAAFEQCVYALMQTMTELDQISATFSYEINIQEDEKGALLVAFLSEFLFLFDTNQYIFNNVFIDRLENENNIWTLHAIAQGEPFNLEKHIQDTEVKAITYSYLEISEEINRVDIKIIYDI